MYVQEILKMESDEDYRENKSERNCIQYEARRHSEWYQAHHILDS